LAFANVRVSDRCGGWLLSRCSGAGSTWAELASADVIGIRLVYWRRSRKFADTRVCSRRLAGLQLPGALWGLSGQGVAERARWRLGGIWAVGCRRLGGDWDSPGSNDEVAGWQPGGSWAVAGGNWAVAGGC